MNEHARRSNPEADRSLLGRCPDCGTPITASYLLIEYESSEGWPQMFAACPDCDAVVHPG